MAYDQATADRVRRMLAGRQDVAEKRMVGGLSFSVNGAMCCGVSGEALMVRVGREAREQVLAERHVRPMEFAGRALAGFVLVDPAGFRTDADLASWVQRGIDYASTLPAAGDARAPQRQEDSILQRDAAEGVQD
jgi:TfoX/Sxy family transcriptional regulator of competence genes